MLKFLYQPYPFETDIKKHYKHHFFIGCFIAFFLIVIQPFGTSIWETDYKLLKLLGYGLVSFLMPSLLITLYFVFFKPQNEEEKWVVAKEIVMAIGILLSVALGNIIYALLLKIMVLNISTFIEAIFSVLILGVFPLTASVFLKYNRFKSLNEKEAGAMEDNLQNFQQKNYSNATIENIVVLIAENEKDTITLNINDLQYIESADNYANIVFFEQNKLQKELLRGALKRFEQQISQPFVLRCHRSFIVNLNQVSNISGNAQGYRITLKNSDTIVPVARNYGPIILEKLKK
jgi:hypothetical protein